ncbi:hypothetical protein [Cryptosporangium sp. NPDC048952]|uniref:hypothetical protein n=1 Tax=Cryptosporangium sp. NPDC048952 TaxID=3363961 RepID=UPI0037200E8C
MSKLELPPQYLRDLTLIAHARDESLAETVGFLLEYFRLGAAGMTPKAAPAEPQGVPVYAIYQGQRIEGTYDPMSNSLTVTSGALAGERFNTPSGAAKAAVAGIKPGVAPNRSGFDFWFVTSTGETLRSIRKAR